MSTNFSQNSQYKNFMKICPVGADLLRDVRTYGRTDGRTEGQTDRQTDMSQLIVVFL